MTSSPGFYRVNYDDHNWNLISNFLNSQNFTKLSVPNRVQVIDDVFNLARAGYVTYSTAFNVGSYVGNETSYVVLQTFVDALTNLDRVTSGHEKMNGDVKVKRS